MVNVVRLKHGQRALVGSQRVIAGSVTGYARQYGDNEAAAVSRANQFGHDLYWLGLEPTVLCGDPGYYDRINALWQDAPVLHFSDVVYVDDSVPLVVTKAPNRNVQLV